VVYYSIATGVGGGVIRDGELYIGRHDNELGHQIVWPAELGGPPCSCGGTGCLEAVVGGEALQRRYQRPGEQINDPAVWEEVGRWLGLAVINTTALFDPDLIVFGGGVCARWAAFAPALQATVAAYLHLQPAPRMQLAALGEDRGLWGALTLIPAELRGRSSSR
jgi:predicted NBD/HSP70 family sugar kinase